jgi:hypothetical protein
MDGDERLARACGQIEKHLFPAACDFLQRRPDGGILIIPAAGFVSEIRDKERLSLDAFEGSAEMLFVTAP